MRKNVLQSGKGVKDYWGKVIYKSNEGSQEVYIFTPNEWTDITCMVYQDVQNKQRTGYQYK